MNTQEQIDDMEDVLEKATDNINKQKDVVLTSVLMFHEDGRIDIYSAGNEMVMCILKDAISEKFKTTQFNAAKFN